MLFQTADIQTMKASRREEINLLKFDIFDDWRIRHQHEADCRKKFYTLLWKAKGKGWIQHNTFAFLDEGISLSICSIFIIYITVRLQPW